MKKPWTDKEDRDLEDYRKKGVPFSEIGRLLGRTANSIAGRCLRLGLCQKAEVRKAKEIITRKEEVKKSYKPQPPKIAPPNKKIARSIIELTHCQCRWPIGDVGSRGFYFCSQTKSDGSPYCPEHNAIAYVKPRKTYI